MKIQWSTGMLSGIKKFSDDQYGGIAVFAALIILPLMSILACVYEYSEYTKIHNDIQRAADNAVLAAFHNPNEEWDQRAQRTNNIFEANLSHKSKMKFAKANLSSKQMGKKTVLTYRVRTGIKMIFAALLPTISDEFTIRASASFDPKSQVAPRLIDFDYSSSSSSTSQKRRSANSVEFVSPNAAKMAKLSVLTKSIC